MWQKVEEEVDGNLWTGNDPQEQAISNWLQESSSQGCPGLVWGQGMRCGYPRKKSEIMDEGESPGLSHQPYAGSIGNSGGACSSGSCKHTWEPNVRAPRQWGRQGLVAMMWENVEAGSESRGWATQGAWRSNEKKAEGKNWGGGGRWDNKEDVSKTELLRGSMALGGKCRESR